MFDPTTNTFILTTSDILTSVTYTIIVTGTLAYPGPSATTSFNLVLISCYSTTITSYAVSDQTFHIYDSANTFSMTQWTESMGVCSPFTYTITQTDGSAIPSLLSFNSGTLLFSVDISMIVVDAVYEIQIVGTLALPGPSVTETF